MSTVQTRTNSTPRYRGYRFGIGCLAILLVSPVLLYYGYCWGLWGRNSLLLQYLFQCNCPVASEEARYPKQVDVIVSSCQYVSSRLSPSGRFLYIQMNESRSNLAYLLDLQTSEEIPFPLSKGSIYFLTDDLIFHSHYGEDEYILDRMTGMKYPIQSFLRLQPQAYSYGELNTSLLFRALSQIEKVFLIDNAFPPVIALSSDFRAHPEHSFTFDYSALPGHNASLLEQFLQQNNIAYYHIAATFLHEAVSPDGRFIARDDGIYLIETGEKIVEGYDARGWFHPYSGDHFSVRGWIYDGTGVIYSKFLNPCLIESSFFLSDEPGCFVEVPQPLLELKVPEEYLSSTEIP